MTATVSTCPTGYYTTMTTASASAPTRNGSVVSYGYGITSGESGTSVAANATVRTVALSISPTSGTRSTGGATDNAIVDEG